MKELLNVGNGAFVISEQGGDFKFSLGGQAALGGGSVAGVLAVEGSGSIVLKGRLGFDAAMKLIEAHSPPALVALEVGAAAVVDAVISGA